MRTKIKTLLFFFFVKLSLYGNYRILCYSFLFCLVLCTILLQLLNFVPQLKYQFTYNVYIFSMFDFFLMLINDL